MPGALAAISRAGMVTAVGLGSAQTASSVRAGIARLSESPFMGLSGAPLTLAAVREDCLPPLSVGVAASADLTERQARMLRLAGPALYEALHHEPDPSGIPVLLAAPETPRRSAATRAGSFLECLVLQSGIGFCVEKSRIFRQGRAAGFLALEEALMMLQTGRHPCVVVGGVDTHWDRRLLARLDAEERLLAGDAMDGFLPGEAACFVVLGAATRSRAGVEPLALLRGVATGREAGHRYSEETYRGEGLADTLGRLFSVLPGPGETVRSVFAGLNGEHIGSKEWGVGYLRNAPRFAEELRVEHPIDCLGDPGAALGPVLMALASIGISKGYVEGPCLVWAASDGGERGAAVIAGAGV